MTRLIFLYNDLCYFPFFFFFFFLIYTESYSEVIPIARANTKGHLKEKKIKKKTKQKKTIIIIIATKQRNKLNRSKIVYDLSLKV